VSGWAPRMGTVFAIAKDNTGMPLAEVERLPDADAYEMLLVAVSILDFKARGKDADRSAVYGLSVPSDLATTVGGQSAERRWSWWLSGSPDPTVYESSSRGQLWCVRRNLAICLEASGPVGSV
jgi:hypothetical protein